ncbi:hypothetical protein [Kitasatospora aureofaciens]|uniref:hypothetical protein n=1 Tax=Kitasatospora aureofaciens TaxID=1894 RepID=UPI003808751C
MSARWLAALAVAVCLLPLVIVVPVLGFRGPLPHMAALVGAAACAVPLFRREQDAFRVSCAAAGAVAAIATVPLLFVGNWTVTLLGGWSLFLLLLYPTAAIPALIAAFHRARGREYGLVAAAVGWFTALASAAGWALATAFFAASSWK